jgi:hypothetical protein
MDKLNYIDCLNELSQPAHENFGRYANFFDFVRRMDIQLVGEKYGSRLYNSSNAYYILTGFGNEANRVITAYGFHGPAIWRKIAHNDYGAIGLALWLRDGLEPELSTCGRCGDTHIVGYEPDGWAVCSKCAPVLKVNDIPFTYTPAVQFWATFASAVTEYAERLDRAMQDIEARTMQDPFYTTMEAEHCARWDIVNVNYDLFTHWNTA